MSYRKFSSRTVRVAAVFLILALLATAALPAIAAVTLTSFTATPQTDGATILVKWSAATELDAASYQLYRSDSQNPDNWGAPIHQEVAGGSVSPADYQYPDTAVIPGVTYWYQLRDISVSGAVTAHGPVSARILLAGETPTVTPSPTLTLAPTSPVGGGGSGGIVATATLTMPPPTATRQYTNTPVTGPTGTAALSAPTATTGVVARATVTPLPNASLATPTGQPLPVTAAPAVAPTAMPVAALSPTLPPPTVAVVAQMTEPPALPTATPVPAREVTPIVFAASETREASETATSEQAVAAQGSRNTNGILVIGGAALGLAGIATAVLLFLKSRKV